MSELTERERTILEQGGFHLDEPAQNDPATHSVPCISLEDAKERLGMKSFAGIKRLVASRGLIMFGKGDDAQFPAFQFVNGGTLPYLQHVLMALPADLESIECANWLTLPNPDLEGPLEATVAPAVWLTAGLDPEPVIELARIFAMSHGRS